MGQILALTVRPPKVETSKRESQKVEPKEGMMKERELRMVLYSHRRWLDGEEGGERASLVGANLAA